jgi:DNA-binding LacI/PurR family transcriptional regulator
MGKVTMNDIAERAGVSKTAVSFAFNDPSRLSEETLRHIMEVASEMEYTRDPVARMLGSRQARRTNSIGLLLPQELPRILANPYYTQFMLGIGQICHREGLTLLLVPPLRGSMLKAIPYATVDGFIVVGLEMDRGEVRELRRREVPFVLVDSEAQPGVSAVEVDDTGGARAVMEYVLSRGHRRIAILPFESGARGDIRAYRGPLARRMKGYREALATAGLSFDDPRITIQETVCTRRGGYEALWNVRQRKELPTAVVALSDIIAIGVLDAAREMGVSVPGEISVVGFDDQPEAPWTQPALTTVHQPIEAKGRVAAEMLVGALHEEGGPTRQTLHTSLIARESVGPAPERADDVA